MRNKLFIFSVIILLFISIVGYTQESNTEMISSLRTTTESFYKGDRSNIFATESIIASNSVYEGAKINYVAARSIKFTPGFIAYKGAALIAKIESINYSNSIKSSFDNKANNINPLDELITVYPNPSDGLINIEMNGAKLPLYIVVYDYIGKSIVNKKMEQQFEQIDLSEYSKGMYILKIKANESVYFNKIIIK